MLLIEDDLDLREGLGAFLSGSGFDVRALGDALDLGAELDAFAPDVVVLDLNLPGLDGFSAALAVRERRTLGIVVLTGRTAREDRVHSLSIGVDHYITKPADPEELVLVIRNLHRRLRADGAEPETSAEEWRFERSLWRLTAPGGGSVTLSRTDYHVLAPLIERPGTPVSRTDLLANREPGTTIDDARGLDLIVFRLRRKVERETGEQLPLLSVRGIGYVFAGKARVR
ncbi:response regulator transcription factor [Segnochrobactrum spirostomi]|uniref:response regulator transcription factor n=1 Tax=Segnochrobactrum spirostomi TaxID=2608987 RepID=UPI001AD84815|nr:response regulator transcription factor [Segnochrobactrum spirostomi]